MMYRTLILLLCLNVAHAEDQKMLPGKMLPGKMLPGKMLPGKMLPGKMLAEAMNLLEGTKVGALELKEARALHIPIEAGLVSKTNVTAVRNRLSTGAESFSFQTEVLISQDKEVVFQALDLAHELVHATHAKNNPFDPKLNLSTYLKHGIEGEGGEAQAIAAECEAGQEIIDQNIKSGSIKNDVVQLIKARCNFVWNTVGQESKWKNSFYHLGEYYRSFLSQVAGLSLSQKEKAELQEQVRAKSPMFASAVAHKPYPLALLEEYVTLTKTICAKEKTKTLNRAIASISLLKERCQAVGMDL